ncbi:hypothetical protein [Rhizobium sp. BK377]|uniref:hypothetical protein n=1 Tax=Rhizobium sp. BK377 TaxID=2587058 RepID=UPI0016203A9B|nr:hypothetical protein [Rhizobium sp. BK377]MBB3461072.1 hypothetical protein [Rhizobium sp. BK377]
MVSKSKLTAIYQGTLVEYDGPQLAYFITSRDYPMLSVAVDHPELGYGMFSVELSDALFDKYMLGKTDLASLFRHSIASRLYFLDFMAGSQGTFKLLRADVAEINNDDFYPSRGIFSRSHTSSINDIAEVGQVVERFFIDGRWDARDFARFSGKLADTYALVRIADKLDDEIAEEDKGLLIGLIDERNWQGGGSYGGFYGEAREKTKRDYPLSVAGIEYHSPGYIDMRGHEDTLNEVVGAISVYRANRESLNEQYRSLHKLLQREGLLTADRLANFGTTSTADLAVKRAIALGDTLGLPNVKLLSDLAGPAPVFVKVVLSFFRRIRDLSVFYAEGRVRSEVGDGGVSGAG